MKVTVIIPLYNRESLIKECLDSVIQQTSRPDEIIVCDDQSSDRSKDIAMQYLHHNASGISFKVISILNSGPSAARKEAIEHSYGDFIFCLDSDDLWKNDYIESTLSILNQHPAVKVTVSNFRKFDNQGSYVNSKFDEAPSHFFSKGFIEVEDGYISSDELFYKALDFQPCFASCLGFYRSTYDAVGGFTLNSRTIKSEDAHLIRRLYLHSCVFFFKRSFVDIRVHDGNRSNKPDGKFDATGKISGKIQILNMILSSEELPLNMKLRIREKIKESMVDLLNFSYWEKDKKVFYKTLIKNPLLAIKNPKILLKSIILSLKL